MAKPETSPQLLPPKTPGVAHAPKIIRNTDNWCEICCDRTKLGIVCHYRNGCGKVYCGDCMLTAM